MTQPYPDHFDDLDAWEADDYETEQEAVDSITNDIVFRPPEPPSPPAAIAAWWNARRNQRRVAPSDARSMSRHIARHLAQALLVKIIRPNANNSETWDAIHTATEEIAAADDQPRAARPGETRNRDHRRRRPDPHPIAEHLHECLNRIAALSPTDVRLSTDAADAWRDTLE